jgi:hypothetical protein
MAQVINARTVGNSIVVSPLALEWTDRMTITGCDTSILPADKTKIDVNFLREIWNNVTEVPDSGDMHPVYPDCCVTSVEVRPAPGNMGDSPDSVQIDVRWLKARNDSAGNRRWIAQIDQYQTQEIRNFDIGGNKTEVKYSIDVALLDRKKFPPRVADIRVPRTMYAFKIIQYENVADKSLANYCNFILGTSPDDVVKLPAYNINDWMGFPANTVIFLGSRTDYQGIPIAKREYSFMTNDRGWNKFIAVYQQKDGFVPSEIQELPVEARYPETDPGDVTRNGIGCFDMLDGFDFADILDIFEKDTLE